VRVRKNFSRGSVLSGAKNWSGNLVGWEQRQGNFWVEDTHTPKFELERGFQVKGVVYGCF